MFAVLNQNLEVTAVFEPQPKSEALFKRAKGAFGKLQVREQAEAVEERLVRSLRQICGETRR